MIAASPAGRMAPPEEIAIAASYLLGPDAGFVTGTDLLIDGGVIAAMRAGKLPTLGDVLEPPQQTHHDRNCPEREISTCPGMSAWVEEGRDGLAY